jgi:hypothetical protein
MSASDQSASAGVDLVCMPPQPSAEHAWLQQLVGEWDTEMECVMGPDQPAMQSKGRESVRSIGGLWTLGEGSGDTPDGGSMTSIMTLGFDPVKQRFVGTFIASMMTHLWRYEGTLDGSGKVLTLDTEGPAMGQEGMTAYQDITTIESPDHRILRSQMRGPDGQWIPFMTAHYRRRT